MTGTAEGDPEDDGLVAEAYRLLLDQPELSLEEYARKLGCTEDSVRSVLERLSELALLRNGPKGCQSVEAVSPMVAIHRLIAREQTLLRQRSRFLQQSYQTFSSILLNYPANGSDAAQDQLVEELTDPPSVRRRLEELAVSVRDEMLSFRPPAADPVATRLATGVPDLAALKRGVRIRTIYTDGLALDPSELAEVRGLLDAGADVRVVLDLPMRLLVVDRELALVAGNPHDDLDGALVVRHPALVSALTAVFESYWHSGRTLPVSASGDSDPSAGERAIMRLLATGAKDDAVARHLGTSVRTVRRIVSDLMTRAGVDSRFALGVYAAMRGWLSAAG
jgi:DNA-binding CsgD family transcriptional regulator